MALPLRRRGENGLNPWPGYVDALSTLLMVIIFVLLVFVLAQAFLSAALSGSDKELARLNRQIAALSSMLSLERGHVGTLQASVATLGGKLAASRAQAQAAAGGLAAARAAAQRAAAAARLARAARADLTARLADAALRNQAQAAQILALQAEVAQAARRLAAAGQTAAVQTGAAQAAAQAAAGKLAAAQAEITTLRGALARALAAQAQGEKQAQALSARLAAARAAAGKGRASLALQRGLTASAQAEITLLTRQMLQLRAQLQAVASALDLAAARNKEQGVVIADLGRKLNAALAAKVQKLQTYRSEFFGKLREVLAGEPDIRIVGDRFVFQSDVLFPSDHATLTAAGRAEIHKIAATLKRLMPQIPKGLHWILRVDGYTDRQPITGGKYASNWELSAARALSVVRILIADGIPPDRLAAAAFGEFHPIAAGDTPADLARNRRIEFRLTSW